MKNLRTSINAGIRSSVAGALTLLVILASQQNEKLMTQAGMFIALNR